MIELKIKLLKQMIAILLQLVAALQAGGATSTQPVLTPQISTAAFVSVTPGQPQVVLPVVNPNPPLVVASAPAPKIPRCQIRGTVDNYQSNFNIPQSAGWEVFFTGIADVSPSSIDNGVGAVYNQPTYRTAYFPISTTTTYTLTETSDNASWQSVTTCSTTITL